jgi:hypothetical protein
MKTVSYKLAKKLKELGFKGATTHYWIKPRGCLVSLHKGKKLGFIESDFEEDKKLRTQRHKAPTLDEMIDALPATYSKEQKALTFTLYKGVVGYFSADWIGYTCKVVNGNLADACAELWILLKENKVI